MTLKIKFKVKGLNPDSNVPVQHTVMLDKIIEAIPTISYSKMAQLSDGLLLFLTNRDQITEIMNESAIEKLGQANIEVLQPFWLQPSIAIFAPKLPSSITNHSPAEIRDEILKSDPEFLVVKLVYPNYTYARV